MKIDVLFDTETTGLLKPGAAPLDSQPYITDIYMMKVERDGCRIHKIDEYETLIKPPIPLSEEITKITGLTDADLEDKPAFAEVYRDIAEFIKGSDRLVAHNLSFDRSMLCNELMRIDKAIMFPWPVDHFCTVEKTMHLEQRRMSLKNLHIDLIGYEFEGAHRARADVEAMFRVYKKAYEEGIFSA